MTNPDSASHRVVSDQDSSRRSVEPDLRAIGADQDEALPLAEAGTAQREVRYVYSSDFVPLLHQLGISLLVSTYQAGKLAVIGAKQQSLTLSFHNFEQGMGVAARPGCIAVGSRRQIWFMPSAPEIARRMVPAGNHDGCFLARTSQVTGEIHGHELAWSGEELWIVNTLFSCLCTLGGEFSFVPRWRPPFISALAAEDRCHLNGLAMAGGQPAYVTAMAETDTPRGWRPNKEDSGCVIEVKTGRTVARGLSMPHSPRLDAGRLWVLDSGRGHLAIVDRTTGVVQPVATLPGYTRGLAMHAGYAFVGMSCIRESAVFGGIPIAQHRDQLRCGVAVIELRSGLPVAYLQFTSGIEEIFAVEVLPLRSPAVFGPFADVDGGQNIWHVPAPSDAPINMPPQ